MIFNIITNVRLAKGWQAHQSLGLAPGQGEAAGLGSGSGLGNAKFMQL